MQKPKERTLIGPAEAPSNRATSSRNGGRNHLGTPSEIKSEWWATSSRIRGRLPPESATNGAAEPQRAKVVRFALEHRFDHVQIEGEHGFGKPEERAYTHAMDVLGVGPDETWMVGDNLEWEIVAPQRLGIYAIWHDGYGVGLPPDCPIRPDRIIRRLSDLLL